MVTRAEQIEQHQARAIEKKAEKQYYQQARTWEAEMYRSARGRARVWAWIAAMTTAIATLCVLTMMIIMPLKEVIPYVIEVDRASGMVEVKRSLIEGGISESEAITKYFIVDYLNAREAYLYDRAQTDYIKVQKMSSPEVAKAHYYWFQPSNDESPLNIFGRKGTIEIKIRNISFIDENTASIPIKRIEKSAGTLVNRYEIVTMSFVYLQDPLKEEDRLINPLGFQVTAYRKDPQLVEGLLK